VSAPLRGAKRSPKASAAKPAKDGTYFAYEVRREGKPLASLTGVSADGGVVVQAAIHPVGRPATDPPVERPFAFTSLEAAERFVDETLTALEYLDCEVVE
jgi:hypothetical protein